MARSLVVLGAANRWWRIVLERGLELRCRDKADEPHRCRKGDPVGEIVVGTPVEDLLDYRAAVHAVVGGANPRRLPVAITSTPVTPSCQVIRRPGVVTNSQTTCGGAEVGVSRW